MMALSGPAAGRLFAGLGLMLLSSIAMADLWRLNNIEVGDRFANEPRYFYVSKGEQWSQAKLHANFITTNGASLSVMLDGKPIYNQYLTRSGSMDILLTPKTSGFHRLDFSLKQLAVSSTQGKLGNDHCEDTIDGQTTIKDVLINYISTRPVGYQIRNLPDALFNPQDMNHPSYLGRIKIDPKNTAELTATARLASAWRAAAGIHWLDSTLSESNAADFTIELRRSPQLARGAFINLIEASGVAGQQGHHPILLLMYKDDKALNAAVNALLNANYLAQARTDSSSIPDNIDPPVWGHIVDIKSLADLGIEDFRLDSSSRSVSLVFPGAWQPTDLMQNSIALRAQSGLMQGSQLSVWLDDTLAGSMKLDALPNDPTEHQIQYLSPALSNNTNYDLRLESTLIANGECLPRSKGSIWVDSHKSLVNLPHRLKAGVAAISPALVPHPDIVVDGSPGSMGVAITLLQVSSKMLLDSRPMPANVSYEKGAGSATVNIKTDEKVYQQHIAAHENKIYGPYANAGTILIAGNDHFDVVTPNLQGAINFMYIWPRVQAQIPDGAVEVLISQDGEVMVLDQIIPRTNETPAVQESTITILICLVLLVMILAIVWWRRKVRRSAGKGKA